MFEYPGNISHYLWTDDATLQADRLYETGAGNGATMLISQQAAPEQIAAGVPLLEQVIPQTSISDQAELDATATSDIRVFANPVAILEAWIRADLDPVLGSYTLGDDARFRITDDWFTSTGGLPGVDTFRRLVGIDVTPPGANSDEVVKLTLGPASLSGTILQPSTLGATLSGLKARLSALERTNQI